MSVRLVNLLASQRELRKHLLADMERYRRVVNEGPEGPDDVMALRALVHFAMAELEIQLSREQAEVSN